MPTTNQIEQILAKYIFPDLAKGRPDYDLPHTQNVVKQLKQLLAEINEPTLDPNVLLIAAYAHDWGYTGLFAPGRLVQYQEVQDMKAKHMEVGAAKLTELLKKNFFDFLTPKQKARAVHIVRVHDLISELNDLDELTFMEADTLGSLDNTGRSSEFDADSSQKFFEGLKRKRLPKFIHDAAIAKANVMLGKHR